MLRLLNLFVDIALLRRNPQDVPASAALLRTCLAFAVVSYVLAISVIYELIDSLLRALFDVAFLGGFVYLVLLVTGHPFRFTQSYTALCGTGALLNLIAWPVFAMIPAGEPSAVAELGQAAAIALTLLIVWGVLITAHIFRHSVGRSFPVGLLIALVYMILARTVSSWIFVEPTV